jgi:hypothetical protein
MIPAKWYVVIMTILGVLGLGAGIADRSEDEILGSLLVFLAAGFAYLFYVRRWKR